MQLTGCGRVAAEASTAAAADAGEGEDVGLATQVALFFLRADAGGDAAAPPAASSDREAADSSAGGELWRRLARGGLAGDEGAGWSLLWRSDDEDSPMS